MSTRLVSLISFVLILSPVLTHVTDAAGEKHLIGWWTFDGDMLDSSGLGNNGTVVGDPNFVAGRREKS